MRLPTTARRLALPLLLMGALGVPSAHAQDPAELLRKRLAERLVSEKPDPKKKPVYDKGGSAAAAAKKPKPHWAYAGEGAPEHWAELAPENKQCGIGKRQSPIDIKDGIKVDLEKIQFDYQPSKFAVVDNGHTIQVNVAPGSSLQIMGRRFELVQFHFHRPSEERVNGRSFDMVAHLVHKDAGGKLAVVAVLLERGRDEIQQPLVQAVWANIPLEKGQQQAGQGVLEINQLLPGDRSYYTYMGSLTTPPCSEEVLWMVLRQPVPLPQAQIDVFAKLYPMNARPVQPIGDRLIKESQ